MSPDSIPFSRMKVSLVTYKILTPTSCFVCSPSPRRHAAGSALSSWRLPRDTMLLSFRLRGALPRQGGHPYPFSLALLTPAKPRVKRSFSFEELQSGSCFQFFDEYDLQFYRVYGQPVFIPAEDSQDGLVSHDHPYPLSLLHYPYQQQQSTFSSSVPPPLHHKSYALEGWLGDCTSHTATHSASHSESPIPAHSYDHGAQHPGTVSRHSDKISNCSFTSVVAIVNTCGLFIRFSIRSSSWWYSSCFRVFVHGSVPWCEYFLRRRQQQYRLSGRWFRFADEPPLHLFCGATLHPVCVTDTRGARAVDAFRTWCASTHIATTVTASKRTLGFRIEWVGRPYPAYDCPEPGLSP